MQGNYRRNPRGASKPGPRAKKVCHGKEGTKRPKEKKEKKGKKEPAKEFSATGALKILIQDEMRSCLCTTNFPPKCRALSVP